MDERAYANAVRNLGVTINPELSYKNHERSELRRIDQLISRLKFSTLDLLPRIIDNVAYPLLYSSIFKCLS